jgi:hypothetical protein
MILVEEDDEGEIEGNSNQGGKRSREGDRTH